MISPHPDVLKFLCETFAKYVWKEIGLDSVLAVPRKSAIGGLLFYDSCEILKKQRIALYRQFIQKQKEKREREQREIPAEGEEGEQREILAKIRYKNNLALAIQKQKERREQREIPAETW